MGIIRDRSRNRAYEFLDESRPLTRREIRAGRKHLRKEVLRLDGMSERFMTEEDVDLARMFVEKGYMDELYDHYGNSVFLYNGKPFE